MEQYWMPRELDFENLRFALDSYTPDNLFIRNVGSYGGNVLVNESLVGKSLDFKKRKLDFSFFVDSEKIFTFPLQEYYKYRPKGFSLAYERDDEEGRMVFLNELIDPYDSRFLEPHHSVLRQIFDNKLLEISFPGRVHLKFHSWLEEPIWKYWAIDKP